MKNDKIEKIAMKVIDEKKQLSIRIPKEFADVLEIDPNKDVFVFKLDREKLHLEGELADKNQIIEEKELKNGNKKTT